MSALGKEFRVVIQSCVVTKIRNTFPDKHGNYEVLNEASDTDSDFE